MISRSQNRLHIGKASPQMRASLDRKPTHDGGGNVH